jgi:hypothetical protein
MFQKIQIFFSSLTTIISSKMFPFYEATANGNDFVHKYMQYSGTLPLKSGLLGTKVHPVNTSKLVIEFITP